MKRIISKHTRVALDNVFSRYGKATKDEQKLRGLVNLKRAILRELSK